jgi:DNA-binding MarR family transcriptional regulator
MKQCKNNKKSELFALLFIVVFSLIFMLFIVPENASAAPPEVLIEDIAIPFVNESSPPISVFSLNLSDDDGAILMNISITLNGVSTGFDPNFDLAPLSNGNQSGIMIYQETNFLPGFQADDSPLGITPLGWMGTGPWFTDFYGIGHTLPNFTFEPNYYVVIRTSNTISNDDSFRVGIETGNVMTNQGGFPASSNWTKIITADTLDPFPYITVYSENSTAKVGDWINITANITGDDATLVLVNLSDFNGLSNAEPMTNASGSQIWYYNITYLLEGAIDTEISRYFFEIIAQDKAGKIAMNGNFSKQIDTILPSVTMGITQENIPASVGSWINITATTDPDTQYVSANLSAFSGQEEITIFQGGGTNWYHNFTIIEGSLDGVYQINVTAEDDAGNQNSDGSKFVSVDEVLPKVDVNVLQKSDPLGVGDWINITVNTDSDVNYVYADLASVGFSNQVDNQSLVNIGGGNWFYNFTISQGSFDGFGTIDIIAIDDAGQVGGNTSQSVYWDEKIPQVTVIVTQEAQPAGIGNWINVTVNADSDVVNVIGDLSEFSGQGTAVSFIDAGIYWFYNFTIQPGSLDGNGVILIWAFDEAGNFNINFSGTPFVNVDEIIPQVDVNIISETEHLGIGDWINITVTTDPDVTIVEADLAYAGFSGQQNGQPLTWSGTDWYYQFTITSGSFDGSHTITVRAVDDAGNIGINNTESASWDEILPFSWVTVTQEYYPVSGVDNWINITVSTDNDVVSVSVDLASAGFTDQVDDQQLIRLTSKDWYYFFRISPGMTDASTGISLILKIVDDAGNVEINAGAVFFDEIYPEPVSVTVKTEAGESNYAKIGDWINITVDAGTNLDTTAMVVDAPGLFNWEPITKKYGSIWFLNTTITEGTADGSIQFRVTTVDLAGNENNTKYAFAFVDNINPIPTDFQIVQELVIAKIGDWINVTVDLQNHSDIASIHVEAPGVFTSRQILNSSNGVWYLNLTIPEGTVSGDVQFNLTILDDAGNEITQSKSTNVNNLPPPVKVTPDGGIPWGLVLLVTAAALVGSGGVVVGATEIGHYSFFFIFYLLYTRLKKEYILDNFTRGRIYGYVEANPGEHFNAIKRALGLKNGSLAYHLRTLEKGGYIVSKRDRGYTRFYPKSMKLPKKNVKELIQIQRSIVEIIKENPGISQRGIADKLNVSYQLVHYHIKVLKEANYLNLKKDKKQTYCYETDDIEEIAEIA